MNEKENEEKRKSYLPTKMSLTIRLAVGLYLLYTVYSLRDVTQKYAGRELIFFIAAIALFGVVGIFLCIHSARAFITGRYADGAMDGSGDMEESKSGREPEETKKEEKKEKKD